VRFRECFVSWRAGKKGDINMVSAWSSQHKLVLGQVNLLQIEGAIITIDAMGCQRDIAQQIVDKKADYVLALKENQGKALA
jgi:hypothetical protein